MVYKWTKTMHSFTHFVYANTMTYIGWFDVTVPNDGF